MARYTTTIASSLSPDDALAYMAAFENALQWDPAVVEASRLDAGEVAVGSTFQIVSKFGRSRVPLRYEVTTLDPGRRVVLEAWNKSFGSVDTITAVASGPGSKVTYDARLIPQGLMKLADPLLHLIFQRVGRAADASLRVHLNPAA